MNEEGLTRIDVLERHFARMGARVRLDPGSTGPGRPGTFAVDVQRDGRGEYFHIRIDRPGTTAVETLHVEPADRHLLLLVRQVLEDGSTRKHKFLCGHDERSWFVAAVPERLGARDVRTAKEALKPLVVRLAQDRTRLRARERNRRRNPVFVRQGEWFFVPTSWTPPTEAVVLHHEPLRRGRSRPHVAEVLCREGGSTVYVCRQVPRPLREAAYARFLARRPEARHWRWEVRRMNAGVYVTGRISHPDHATVVLRGWHRVAPNTEQGSGAMEHLAFID